jgi:uncharacterized oligopeptide transporter (OPT) family protein
VLALKRFISIHLEYHSGILENNLVQTAASAGESLAAGVIFTFPALIIMHEDDDDSDVEGWGHFRYVETVVIAIAGGGITVLTAL